MSSDINFSSGDLTYWSATTGLVNGAKFNYPAPNAGVSSIPEYSIAATGINVITSSFQDPSANFVYFAQGKDYTGKVISKKGNITLIH